MLGSLAALAIGGGIYFATKGRGGTKSVVGNSNKSVVGNSKSTDNLAEMTIDAFKKAGNYFENGIAYRADSTQYTGKLTHQTKDGVTLVLEYSKPYGNCCCTATRYKNGNIISAKRYSYFENKLRSVEDATLPSNADYDQRMILAIVDNYIRGRNSKITKNKQKGTMKIASRNGNYVRYYKSGKLEYISDNCKYTIFHPDGKTKLFTIADEIIVYNEEGKEIAKYAIDDEGAKRYLDIFKQKHKDNY